MAIHIDEIIRLLKAERYRIEQGIIALTGSAGNELPEWVTGKKPTRKKRKGRLFTPEQRALQSKKAKAMWKTRRAKAAGKAGARKRTAKKAG